VSICRFRDLFQVYQRVNEFHPNFARRTNRRSPAPAQFSFQCRSRRGGTIPAVY
jgi:hypothetical protein